MGRSSRLVFQEGLQEREGALKSGTVSLFLLLPCEDM